MIRDVRILVFPVYTTAAAENTILNNKKTLLI